MAKKKSIKDVWSMIEAWLKKHAPRIVKAMEKPATASDIAKAEKAIGQPLPAELRELYLLHNGGEESDLFPSSEPGDMGYSLIPLRALASTYRSAMKDADGKRSCDVAKGVQAVEWCEGWIPFASNGGGDFQCVDLSPGTGGSVGQVIEVLHETGERRRLASSLTERLASMVQGLKRGTIEYDEETGLQSVSAVLPIRLTRNASRMTASQIGADPRFRLIWTSPHTGKVYFDQSIPMLEKPALAKGLRFFDVMSGLKHEIVVITSNQRFGRADDSDIAELKARLLRQDTQLKLGTTAWPQEAKGSRIFVGFRPDPSWEFRDSRGVSRLKPEFYKTMKHLAADIRGAFGQDLLEADLDDEWCVLRIMTNSLKMMPQFNLRLTSHPHVTTAEYSCNGVGAEASHHFDVKLQRA